VVVRELAEKTRGVIDLVEGLALIRSLALPTVAQVRERPLDRVTQQRQGREPTVDELGGTEREVTRDDPDLIPARREALEQVIDDEIRPKWVRSVQPGGVNRGLAEVIDEQAAKGASARLRDVDEEEPMRLLGIEPAHPSTPMTSRTRKASS
jgi:hypothetical protein